MWGRKEKSGHLSSGTGAIPDQCAGSDLSFYTWPVPGFPPYFKDPVPAVTTFRFVITGLPRSDRKSLPITHFLVP